MAHSTDPVGASGDGPRRTDMHCHHCNKGFVALLDFSINGNHILECPSCGHEHCRVIKHGVITAERWDTREQRVNVDRRCTWKSNVLQAQTSTVSMFLRDAWLNRSDY